MRSKAANRNLHRLLINFLTFHEVSPLAEVLVLNVPFVQEVSHPVTGLERLEIIYTTWLVLHAPLAIDNFQLVKNSPSTKIEFSVRPTTWKLSTGAPPLPMVFNFLLY